MAKVSKSDPKQYTKPELRDKIKSEVTAGDKGGRAGQWSARKAQLVTHEYEKQGGDYKKSKTGAQKSLESWGDEQWTTSDGKKAERKDGTTRYLPKEAWEKLSEKEKEATNKKKQEGSRAGEQFVSNTPAASTARKKASAKKSSGPSSGKKKETARTAAKKQGAPTKTAPQKRATKKTSASSRSSAMSNTTAPRKSAHSKKTSHKASK